MDTRIYEITHKKFPKPDLPEYIRLQVGAALHKNLGYVADNTGDNISEKNPHYCELTGIYWLWKNISCDIIGVCHYKRYLLSNDDFLTKDEIETVLRDYDVILPNSLYVKGASVYEHFNLMHHIKDLDAVRDVISELYPDYLDSFDLSVRCGQITPTNMIVTRKEIFDKYCSWLFSILFEVEKRIDITGYDDYQTRIFGFLSERLTNVFFIHNSYKIKEYHFGLTNPAEYENSFLLTDTKKNEIRDTLSDLNKSYKDGTFDDLIDSRPMDIDFHGKTPVWFCWWQGIDNTPDVVRLCLSSILNNIPADKAELHFITMENFIQYINLPDWVVKKFVDGKISLSHLSYILRFGLIYRYGGVWLDADDYMASPFTNDFWNSIEFYSPHSDKPSGRTDITDGKWSLSLIKSEAGNTISRYMMNALYEYWNTNDELIDDLVPDCILRDAYEQIPEIKKLIDSQPITQAHMKDLEFQMDDTFTKENWQEMTSDTNVFSLSYKNSYRITNLIGDKTFYGFLLDSAEGN